MTEDTPTAAPEPLGSGYLLETPIGSGAMGQVFRAATRDGAPVAIKVLRPELSTDPAVVARFVQEAQILQRLDDPHLVRVRDLVAEGSRLAIVMDLVEGPDLRSELVRRGTFRPIEAAEIVDSVLAGLAVVHAGGVVHRDVKPENVLLAGGVPGGARLTDFGIARIIEESQKARRTTVIGTPEYLAPEVADGATPTAASDLYAVGILLYELVAGVTPFAGGSPLAVLRRHAEQQPVRPDGMPDGVWATVSELLAKDPGRRPQDATTVRRMLEGAAPGFAAAAALPPLAEPPARPLVSQPTVQGLRADTDALPTVPSAGASPAHARSRRRGLLVAVAALLVLLVGGGGVALALSGGGDDSDAGSGGTVASESSSPRTSSSSAPRTTTGSRTTTAESTAPAVVPDVTGMTLAAAQTMLKNAGLQVQVVEQVDDSRPDNTVTAQDPSAGGSIDPGATVTLTVVRKSIGTYLSTLQPVEQGYYGSTVGTTSMNGQTYVRAITAETPCTTGFSDPQSAMIQYDLGRKYQTLTMSVGLTDDSDADATVQFVILLDGRQVFSEPAGLGRSIPVNLDVTGVLRLEVSAIRTDEGCNYNSPEATAVWADPQLIAPGTTD
jgi:serine/threonine-protein kinase